MRSHCGHVVGSLGLVGEISFHLRHLGVVLSVAGNAIPEAPGWFLQHCLPGKEGDDSPALPGNSWGKAMI